MGKIVIVTDSKTLPDSVDSHVGKNLVDLRQLGSPMTTEEWFTDRLRIGSQQPTGAEILSAIEKAKEDILLIGILSQSYGSEFNDEVPGVVFNFGSTGFIASDPPTRMAGTVMLFHELGHAAQWILRREWFMQSVKQAKSSGAFKKKGYFEEIEMDNLVRHEWPLSKQLGLPTRMHYEDVFNTEGQATQHFAKTTAAATTIQRAWRRHAASQEKK